MCPSYRVTKDEKDVVRGRANSLRLALSGRFGEHALSSDAMADTMKLCVGCKACHNECPTSVDMAKMKTEVAYQRAKRHGISVRDKLIAYLPRYAPWVTHVTWVANLRDQIPGLPWLTEKLFGLSKERKLPVWHGGYVAPSDTPDSNRPVVVLLSDTFNRNFEPDNLYAARELLDQLGYEVIEAASQDGSRPVCCGRTFLAAGLVDEARVEAARFIEAVLPWVKKGYPVVGLEPSCLLTLRDEFLALLPGEDASLLAAHAYLFEEFIEKEISEKRLSPKFKPANGLKVMVHGHCHQKAARAMGPVESILRRIPGLEIEIIESSCCGMAGHFGYQAETVEISKAMGELSLLPAVRSATPETRIVADGTSCRHQIADSSTRQAEHIAVILAEHLSKD